MEQTVTEIETERWEAATAQASGLSHNHMKKMEESIESGEFKKITSVVVARHGKLAYEKYFDGSTLSLRNTRSATKTVASILVGIAIDKGLIDSAQALIFSFFKDKLPVRNP